MAIYQTVNENMANAARIYLSEKGANAEKYTLVSFGGAGPLHVAALARSLGVRHIIVPRFAGVASALGFLVAPKSFETVRTQICRLDSFDTAQVAALLDEMIEEGRTVLQGAEIADDQISFQIKADMRYLGQKHEITAPIAGALEAKHLMDCFEAEYRRIFGRTYPDIPVEVLNWRVVSSAPPGKFDAGSMAQRVVVRNRPSAWREVVEPSGATTSRWPVYQWNELPTATKFLGPALIEDPYTTVVVSSFFDFEMDERCCVHLRERENPNDGA
jgi:N-methylhydantoinase A